MEQANLTINIPGRQISLGASWRYGMSDRCRGTLCNCIAFKFRDFDFTCLYRLTAQAVRTQSFFSQMALAMSITRELFLHLPVTLHTWWYCLLSYLVLGEGVSYAYDLGKILLSAGAGGKCLTWWEVPDLGGLSKEVAECCLQVQVRASLRSATVGNANQDRMAPEIITQSTFGY